MNSAFHVRVRIVLSTTESAVQRNLPSWLWKLREMGAIPRFLLSNRTGESVLPIATGKVGSLFSDGRPSSPVSKIHVANAMRSQIDDVAKAALTFLCRQAFISIIHSDILIPNTGPLVVLLCH
jgi:hypothetical protein